jgi:hypothetical protein
MAELSNRQIVEHYMAAMPRDEETLRALRHEQFVEEWPQYGERIRGADRAAQISTHYPGGKPTGSVERVVGSDEHWVMTPSFTCLRTSGGGSEFTVLAHAQYPDGSSWYITVFLELRDHKIFKAVSLFAPELEAPAWRAEWVERMS